MADNATNQIDEFTSKYTEGFEKFSKSQSGNLVLDFILFKRNLIPCTLQIVFILGVVAAWIVAIMGIFGQGPLGSLPSFLTRLGVCLVLFAFAPFVLHYALELVKVLWRFVVHVYEKVLVPLWNTLVVCFFANVAPQVLPFLYQRFMKLVDIVVNKVDPLLDAVIDMIVALSMTIIALLKGCLWLPKRICERIAKWLDKLAADKNK